MSSVCILIIIAFTPPLIYIIVLLILAFDLLEYIFVCKKIIFIIISHFTKLLSRSAS